MPNVKQEIHNYGNNDRLPEEKLNTRWWTTPDENIYQDVFATVNDIKQKQSWRRVANIRNARLYSNREAISLFPGFAQSIEPRPASAALSRLTLNVVKACIDTACSKIGKQKPRAYYLTQDGKWDEQRRAKRMTAYMEGWAYDQKLYASGRSAFKEGATFGTGALKAYIEDGKVKSEKVFIDEIIVDEVEGIYGTPQQMYQTKYVPRDVVIEVYGTSEKLKFAIAGASATGALQVGSRSKADFLEVLEAWHLPSGPKANDGKKVICIENMTLAVDKWKHQRFPFSFYRWSQPLLGFYGTGISEELMGIQIEINKILMDIQEAQHLVARPTYWLEASNRANKARVSNLSGGINYFVGQAPILLCPPPMPPEVYAQLENLYRKAFEITGTSQMSASGKKPSGVDAAVAMRELQDIESERFMTTTMDFEDMYMDHFDLSFDLHEELYESGIDVEIRSPGKKAYQAVKWSDVRLKRESFVSKTFPAALLPTSPAGKLAKTQELVQAGFIPREQALELLDFPDLEKFSNMANAPLDNIMRCIDLMLDGKTQVPDPMMNLALARKLTQQAINSAKNDGAPDDVLDVLLGFIEGIDEIERQVVAASAPPPAPMVDPMMAPAPEAMLAAPEALPVSDIVPQVPM